MSYFDWEQQAQEDAIFPWLADDCMSDLLYEEDVYPIIETDDEDEIQSVLQEVF